MSKRGIRHAMFAIVVSLAALLIENGLLNAQAQGGAAPAAPLRRVSVQITQVKPDQVATFRAIIQKEVIPAEKKAGVAWRHTYTGTPLGEQFTYVTVRPVQSLAQFDQPGVLQRALGADAAAKLNARIAQTIVSRRSIMQTFQPAVSIESGATEPANLIVVEDVQVHLDKGQPFTQWLTSQMVPALKKAGVKDYWVFATTWGGPAQHRTIVEPIPNFASLEPVPGQPNRLARAVGAEAAQKINAQRSALVQSQERRVMRLVPELSYTTSPQRTSR